jgi:hypothetical protein
MSSREEQLYPEIEAWCKQYLTDKYKGCTVTTTHKTSQVALDSYFRTLGIEIKEAMGLAIKVDIVGLLQKQGANQLVFIEVKDKPLTLADLGQLWGYTELLNPVESFLLSSEGVGSLEYLFKVLKREDLLVYGGKHERMMRVGKWNVQRKAVDYATLIPKI